MGIIKFNVQETIQKEYELDLADSEKVIRRAKEMYDLEEHPYPLGFYQCCAIQELLDKDEICATLIDEDCDSDLTSSWEVEEED
jgi:hypothetical protein